MKICQVLGGNIKQIGGLEHHVLAISAELVKTHDVALIAHPAIEKSLPEGVTFFPLDLSKGRFNLGNLLRLKKIIKDERFDVVHAHANKACFLLALIKPFCHFSFIATLHGQKKKLWAYSRADHVISVSRRIARKVANKNLTVIPNGVSLPVVTQSLRSLCGIEEEEFLFCALGRLEKVKGFDLLIRAFIDVPAKLAIIGDGSERTALEKLIAETGVQEKVSLPGFLQDASGYLRQADATVISSHREGFSYVFAESLLSRTPIVSTDVADISLTLNSQYIAPVGNVEKLTEKMKYVVDNKSRVLKDFESAFRYAKEELVFSVMIKKIEHVYKENL